MATSEMSDPLDYDSKNLDVLRRDLQDLRGRAREEGLIHSDKPDRPAVAAGGGAARRFAQLRQGGTGGAEPGEKGKQLAARILAMLRRSIDDDSPLVPGTDFTEGGVKRLMDHLTAPPKGRRATAPLIERLHKFLAIPAQPGGKMIAGASLERIRMLGNLLPQVEKHGWDQVKEHMAKRKENRAKQVEANVAPAPRTAPATKQPATKQKRRSKRATA
jgi:hypothetical protein